MPITSPCCYLCFWPVAYKPKVPGTISSGSYHLRNYKEPCARNQGQTYLYLYLSKSICNYFSVISQQLCQKSIARKCEVLFLDSQFYSIEHMCLSICQYCTIYILILENMNPSTLVFFKMVLALLRPLYFHLSFKISL